MTRYPPSPVPSDQHLWPGELPFTAFGQYGEGHLDLRVFDQDTYWVDRHGTPHRLDDMTLDYQRNVIVHLHQHADEYWIASRRRDYIQRAGDLLLYGMPKAQSTQATDEKPIHELTPATWLELTPLMRRLRHLTNP